MSSVHWILESSAMNAVTRRDDYRPAGPHLLQRPFNLPLCLFNLSIAPHNTTSTPTTTHREGMSSGAPMEFGEHRVETHAREIDLSVVYTIDPAVVDD